MASEAPYATTQRRNGFLYALSLGSAACCGLLGVSEQLVEPDVNEILPLLSRYKTGLLVNGRTRCGLTPAFKSISQGYAKGDGSHFIMRKRDRDTEKQRDRETDTATERERQRDRETERQTETDREKERGTERRRGRETERETDLAFFLTLSAIFVFLHACL